MRGRRIESALYIDWANMYPRFPAGVFLKALPAWLAWLEDGKFHAPARRRKFLHKRVYLNDNFRAHTADLEAVGFEVIPSSDDMLIALDVADSIHENAGIKEYVLLTVDEDFVHLLARLGEHGKRRVVTIGPKADTRYPCTKTFPPLSDITIALDDLETAFGYERRRFLGKVTLRFPFLERWLRPRNTRASARPIAADPSVEIIAEYLVALAHSKPGVPIGRAAAMRCLQRNMQGFRPNRYSYRNKYERLLRKVVAVRSDLQLFRDGRGRLAIMAPRPAKTQKSFS